jgi:hypothetical protein
MLITIPAKIGSLTEAIDLGLALTQTKQKPKSRIIADWQSTETLYAVVDAEMFEQWRKAVLAYLIVQLGADSDSYWVFHEECRFPQYMELLEGIKVLKHIEKMGASDS